MRNDWAVKVTHRSQFLLSTEVHSQFHTNLEAWIRRFASVIIHKVSSQGSSSDSTRVVIWTLSTDTETDIIFVGEELLGPQLLSPEASVSSKLCDFFLEMIEPSGMSCDL